MGILCVYDGPFNKRQKAMDFFTRIRGVAGEGEVGANTVA